MSFRETLVKCAFCGQSLSKEDLIVVEKKNNKNEHLAKHQSVVDSSKNLFLHESCFSSNSGNKKKYKNVNSAYYVNRVVMMFLFNFFITYFIFNIFKQFGISSNLKDLSSYAVLIFFLFIFWFSFFEETYNLYLTNKYNLFPKIKNLWIVPTSAFLGFVMSSFTVIFNIKSISLLLNFVIGSMGIIFISIGIISGLIISYKRKENF